MIWLVLALQFFSPSPLAQRTPDTLSAGSWVSCPLDDGSGGYGEKALDYKTNGHAWFEIHYGPRDAFSIFAGNTPEHIDHDDARNLLKPSYHYGDFMTAAGGRNWSIASLGISLNVIAIPSTQADCYAYVVLLERDKRPTWAQQ